MSGDDHGHTGEARSHVAWCITCQRSHPRGIHATSADQPLTGDELATIKARAEAVPDGWGDWSGWQHYQILGLVTPTKIDGWAHPEKRRDAMLRTDAAVDHIAGMDPATTLRLVAEIERQEARLRRNEVAIVQLLIRAEAAEARLAKEAAR